MKTRPKHSRVNVRPLEIANRHGQFFVVSGRAGQNLDLDGRSACVRIGGLQIGAARDRGSQGSTVGGAESTVSEARIRRQTFGALLYRGPGPYGPEAARAKVARPLV